MSTSTRLIYTLRKITPDYHAEVAQQSLIALRGLLQEGVDPNKADETGLTPLMFLATDKVAVQAMNSNSLERHNHLTALRILVEFGADTMANNGEFYQVVNQECILQVLSRLLDLKSLNIDTFLAGARRLSLGGIGGLMTELINTSPHLLTSARETDGATLAHVIWRHHAPHALRQFWDDPLGEMNDVNLVWNFVNYAVGMGLNIHAKDHQDQSCVDLMLALREQGFPGPVRIVGSDILRGVIASHDQAKIMERDTPEVSTTSAKMRF